MHLLTLHLLESIGPILTLPDWDTTPTRETGSNFHSLGGTRTTAWLSVYNWIMSAECDEKLTTLGFTSPLLWMVYIEALAAMRRPLVLFLYVSLTLCYLKKGILFWVKKEEKGSLGFYWHTVYS